MIRTFSIQWQPFTLSGKPLKTGTVKNSGNNDRRNGAATQISF